MTIHETVGRNQKQAMLALHHVNEAVLDVVKPLMSRTEPYIRITRELPYVDRLPTAKESLEQWFGFFEDVLREERTFLNHVVDLLPQRGPTSHVVKTAPKAA